jgi:hypothetical protein
VGFWVDRGGEKGRGVIQNQGFDRCFLQFDSSDLVLIFSIQNRQSELKF